MNPLRFFKCLSDDTRLQSVLIVCQLGEACVCDLMVALNLDQPKVSRHLSDLRKCKILQDDRRGKWVYYQLHNELPSWAKEVIFLTAGNNQEYISESINKLQSAKQKSLSC